MSLKLYHISQDKRTGWDTYSDAVVSAPDENFAKTMHPEWPEIPISNEDWCDHPNEVKAVLIGEADKTITEPKVICASFHAG